MQKESKDITNYINKYDSQKIERIIIIRNLIHDTIPHIYEKLWSKLLRLGAAIIEPMRITTYSSCFVSLIDRFGMRWELMMEKLKR